MEQPCNVIPFPYRHDDFIPVTSPLVNRLTNICIKAGMPEAESRASCAPGFRCVHGCFDTAWVVTGLSQRTISRFSVALQTRVSAR